MSTAIRINNLALDGGSNRTLEKAEMHGKRLDATSQKRKVREAKPLVYGGLDLRKAYDAHMEGVRMNAATKKPVMHALVQWPTTLSTTPENKQAMFDHTRAFMESRFGGDAVFAMRFDQDEKGEHVIDVFMCPKYVKNTSKKGAVVWASTSKFSKELCQKHRAEIERRNSDGKFTDNLRSQGMALQSEWREYLENTVKLTLPPKHEKGSALPDRLSPETYGAQKDAERLLATTKGAVVLAEDKAREIVGIAEVEAEELRLAAQKDWDYVCAVAEANGIRPSDLIQPDDTLEPPRG